MISGGLKLALLVLVEQTDTWRSGQGSLAWICLIKDINREIVDASKTFKVGFGRMFQSKVLCLSQGSRFSFMRSGHSPRSHSGHKDNSFYLKYKKDGCFDTFASVNRDLPNQWLIRSKATLSVPPRRLTNWVKRAKLKQEKTEKMYLQKYFNHSSSSSSLESSDDQGKPGYCCHGRYGTDGHFHLTEMSF